MEKILSLLFLINTCIAHISMSFPPSRRNQLSKYYVDSGLVNYNLRSPLMVADDFFVFPCKGFPKGPSVATFNDNKLSITLEGVAVHGGGHCQFGISYDDKTFIVLQTVIGNCLLDTKSYSFDLPPDAKGGDITIFWTWINRIGNREYYMECADITVNTNGNNKQIAGKELLIVNLPGYPKIPEWEPNSPSSIDGRDLLNSRKDTTKDTFNTIKDNVNTTKDTFNNTTKDTFNTTKDTFNTTKDNVNTIKDNVNTIKDNVNTTKDNVNTTSQPCITKTIPSQILPTNDTNEQVGASNNKNSACNQGEMRCNNKGFDTCIYDLWVYRNCASGTTCKPNGNSVVCDFI
jgi:hypothetical protein